MEKSAEYPETPGPEQARLPQFPSLEENVREGISLGILECTYNKLEILGWGWGWGSLDLSRSPQMTLESPKIHTASSMSGSMNRA